VSGKVARCRQGRVRGLTRSTSCTRSLHAAIRRNDAAPHVAAFRQRPSMSTDITTDIQTLHLNYTRAMQSYRPAVPRRDLDLFTSGSMQPSSSYQYVYTVPSSMSIARAVYFYSADTDI